MHLWTSQIGDVYIVSCLIFVYTTVLLMVFVQYIAHQDTTNFTFCLLKKENPDP
jgi:hypothetical protein